MSSLPTKGSIRAIYREKRNAISPADRRAFDEALCRALSLHPAFADADVILGFYPVSGEPDLSALYELAWAQGKTVAFPISHKESRTMCFCAVDSMADLAPGAYGIHEPVDELRAVHLTARTLCLVPGLAFDREGYRLGYGGGYYDRFLSRFPGVSLAPTYSVLLTDTLPREETDLPVAHIVTERA